MRYSPLFVNVLSKEYLSGESLNSLSRKHGIPRSSIYYQLTLLDVVRKVHSVKKRLSDDELYLGLFIGLWAGDGNRANNRHNYAYSVRFFFNRTDRLAVHLLYTASRVLFGVLPTIVEEKPHMRVYQFTSKFIFNFLDEYLLIPKPKCARIALARPISFCSPRFLKGFLVGLALSDGSFGRNRFSFASASPVLALQFAEVLMFFGFCPKISVSRRIVPTWNPLWRVRLNKSDAQRFQLLVQNWRSD